MTSRANLLELSSTVIAHDLRTQLFIAAVDACVYEKVRRETKVEPCALVLPAEASLVFFLPL